MTQEEKATRYDEAIKVANKYKDTHIMFPQIKDEIFPELKESDDERIRKAIIYEISLLEKESVVEQRKNVYQSWIAWLEKQNSNVDNANKEYWRGYREGKQEILDKYAEFEKQGEKKPTIEMKSAEESLGIDSETYNKIVDECIYGEQKPAEWSEEDEKIALSIEQVMNCASLLNMVPEKENKIRTWLKSLKDRVQPQHKEWSKEDNAIRNDLINYFRGSALETSEKEVINWLKSIKDRVQPQKQEWSDVDKGILFHTIDNLRFLRDDISKDPKYVVSIIDVEREIAWLKSIRLQNTWKPSEEQIKALAAMLTVSPQSPAMTSALIELYQNLKKLKG